MKTSHRIYYANSRSLNGVADESVDLIVTSPPYPMIEMWDEIFSSQSQTVEGALNKKDGAAAFESMHQLLDEIWGEAFRVLKIGGFACINIGDATRTINGNFALYPNHMRILKTLLELGFNALPCVLWRKQTNAPNKFMGSGMLPAGAYVTLEHEYILIVRKGPKRTFHTAAEKENRHESALFWEERNAWFSDVWFDVKGTSQSMNHKESRQRSGAFPFELAYRLINMYSVKGDTVLDPFLGTGTATCAAAVAARNSIGFEIDRSFSTTIYELVTTASDTVARELIRSRLARHMNFVENWTRVKGPTKHRNQHYGFPVVTAQEKELLLNEPRRIEQTGRDSFEVEYSETPQETFCKEGAFRNAQQTFSFVAPADHTVGL